MTARGLAMGLVTVLGLARRGFFIPYRYAARLPAGSGAPYGPVAELFAASADAFHDTLAAIEAVAEALEALGEGAPPAPRWGQDWFPRLDAAALYALVRRRTPGRIVEVGAGHSTRFIARAVADGGLACHHTVIDPAPRAVIEGLPLALVRAPLQEAGLEAFRALGPGDMVVIDSSHVLMPGSDVDFLLNRALPLLPPGVLVHFHDVFLPWDYPAEWAWRGYNEQVALGALLLGGGYRPLFSSRYALGEMSEAVMATVVARLPLAEGAHESSLWLRKT